MAFENGVLQVATRQVSITNYGPKLVNQETYDNIYSLRRKDF